MQRVTTGEFLSVGGLLQAHEIEGGVSEIAMADCRCYADVQKLGVTLGHSPLLWI